MSKSWDKKRKARERKAAGRARPKEDDPQDAQIDGLASALEEAQVPKEDDDMEAKEEKAEDG
jgi:hypothetical protein